VCFLRGAWVRTSQGRRFEYLSRARIQSELTS
jgi:hypothetical protein